MPNISLSLPRFAHRRADQEKRARQLLGEHLEEGNMNVSRLAALLRKAEEEKGGLNETIASLKEKKKVMEEDKTKALELVRKMEEESIESERSINDHKLKMKDLENSSQNAVDSIEGLKSELSDLEKKLEQTRNLLESAEKQKSDAVERDYKMKEELMSKGNDHSAAMSEMKAKMEELERNSKSDVDKFKDGVRDMELKLVQKDGEVEKLREKCKGLEEIEAVLTKQAEERDSRVEDLEKTIAYLKGEEKEMGKNLNAKQKSVRELQRLVDRKLVPIKLDLQQLRVQVGAELESFGKDTYDIVKRVHEKWGEKNKVVTRR